MAANRIFSHNRRFEIEVPTQPQAVQTVPAGFAVCPAAFMANAAAQQLAWQRQIYQHAYEQARRNVIPFYMRPLLAGN